MKRFHHALIFIVTSTLLAGLFGCSNPKTASKSNFTDAINAFWVQNPACVIYKQMPIKVYTTGLLFAIPMNQEDALVSAGLFKVSQGSESGPKFVGGHANYNLYSLTDQGKSLWRNLDPADSRGGDFCFARRQVTSIVQNTAPTNVKGSTVTTAQYEYEFAGIPSWAKNPAVVAAFPIVKAVLVGKHTGTETLVQMNTGWVVQMSLYDLM